MRCLTRWLGIGVALGLLACAHTRPADAPVVVGSWGIKPCPCVVERGVRLDINSKGGRHETATCEEEAQRKGRHDTEG